jgi:hypothetical protein
MEEARRYIRESLSQAKNPSLLVSFGKESLVLLKLVREIKPNISLFWFGDKLSSFAQSIIKDYELTVYSYAPADRYIVPCKDGYSLIDEYSFGETRIPLISDLVKSDVCELNLPTVRTPLFNWRSDVTLWGYRALDVHPLVGIRFPQRFDIGATVMDSPLWNWTEDDVFSAIEELRIPYEPESSDIPVCEACLEEINATMDKEAALAGFRSRFQFSH